MHFKSEISGLNRKTASDVLRSLLYRLGVFFVVFSLHCSLCTRTPAYCGHKAARSNAAASKGRLQ